MKNTGPVIRKKCTEKGNHMSKIAIMAELLEYLRAGKKYWLIPVLLALACMGFLLILLEGSALSPFIYTLF